MNYPCRAEFERDGFVFVERLVDEKTVARLNDRLECLLRGEYDLGTPPLRAPKPGGGKLAQTSKRTVHVVDARRCDRTFRAVVENPALAALAARCGGWPGGARVANDQVWAKPPGAGALCFHRDAPYFDALRPTSRGAKCACVTVWLALDDCTDDAVGPLTHVRRADISPTHRGDAAAATWLVRGDESMPRPRRGYSAETSCDDAAAATAETSNSDAAAATWLVRGDASRRRRGRDRRDE